MKLQLDRIAILMSAFLDESVFFLYSKMKRNCIFFSATELFDCTAPEQFKQSGLAEICLRVYYIQ